MTRRILELPKLHGTGMLTGLILHVKFQLHMVVLRPGLCEVWNVDQNDELECRSCRFKAGDIHHLKFLPETEADDRSWRGEQIIVGTDVHT